MSFQLFYFVLVLGEGIMKEFCWRDFLNTNSSNCRSFELSYAVKIGILKDVSYYVKHFLNCSENLQCLEEFSVYFRSLEGAIV